MTTQGRIARLLIVSVLIAAPVRAQEPAPASATAQRYIDERAGLGLDAAIARALEREPTIRATRADIDVARGRVTQAALRPNPSMTFERRTEPGGTDRLTSVGIEWPLDLFRRPGRLNAAAGELAATRLAVSNRERLLVSDVRLQYGAAAAAIRDLDVADELVATARRQLALVRARVDEGATPPVERDLLEVDLARLEAERLRAAGQTEVAMVLLKQLLGMDPDESLRIQQTLESLVTGSGPADAPAGSAQTSVRPDVREAEARVSLADARVDQARRDGRVDVSLFGAYMRMDAGFAQQGFTMTGELERVRGQFHSVAGGAVVMVPLFNRNQGEVAAALAARAGAEARRDAAALAARTEVAAAAARDAQAQRAVALYAGGLRTLARQNLDVIRQTFELGRATVFDVLAEQRRFIELEQTYTTTLREAWDARTALLRARGETR